MKKKDFRNIPQKAQDEIRKMAVKAVLAGKTQTEVSTIFGVSRSSVNIWVNNYKRKGKQTLVSQKRGTSKKSKLKGYQAATIVNIIKDRHPEQLKLPFVLWTREAVQMVIKKKFKIELSLSTVGRYLAKWGMTSQKPLKRAYEQDNKAVQEWINKEYPKIKKRAKKEKAEIYWGDETGIRSDHQTGKGYSKKGKTPVVLISAKRFKTNVISAVNNSGKLVFSVFEGKFNSKKFIDFIKRLIKHSKSKKIFLIVDNLSVHKSEEVKKFIGDNISKVKLFYLPTYSPELNPDELLNNDLKSNLYKAKRPTSKTEQIQMIRNKLRSIQQDPKKVQNYFKAEKVRYTA
jgi:transposase